MHEAGPSKPVLWDNVEGWGGEGGWWGVQDWGTHVASPLQIFNKEIIDNPMGPVWRGRDRVKRQFTHSLIQSVNKLC